MKKLLLAALAMISTKALCNDIQTAVELEMVQKLMNKKPYFIYYLSVNHIAQRNLVEASVVHLGYTGQKRFADSRDLYLEDFQAMYDDLQACKQGKKLKLKGNFRSCQELAVELIGIKLNNPQHAPYKDATVAAVWKNGK